MQRESRKSEADLNEERVARPYLISVIDVDALGRPALLIKVLDEGRVGLMAVNPVVESAGEHETDTE